MRSLVTASVVLLLAASGCARPAASAGTMASRPRPVSPSRWLSSTPAMRALLRSLTLADRVGASLGEGPLGTVRGDRDRMTAQVAEAREAWREASRAGALLDCERLDDVDFPQTQAEPDVWGPYRVDGTPLDFLATRTTVTPFVHRDPREAGVVLRASDGRMMISVGCGEALAVVVEASPGRPRCERFGACPAGDFLAVMAGEQVDLEALATRLRRRSPSAHPP